MFKHFVNKWIHVFGDCEDNGIYHPEGNISLYLPSEGILYQNKLEHQGKTDENSPDEKVNFLFRYYFSNNYM